MRKTSNALMVFLGMAAVASSPTNAAPGCDLSWMGTSLSATNSQLGHIVLVRGTDGYLRFNEWNNATSAYTGWTLLPGTNYGSDPWIQRLADNAHNIYFQSGDAIHQLICRRSTNGWAIEPTSVPNANNVAHRVTSVQSGSENKQKMFATFKDGTLRSRTWDGSFWDESWTYEGLSNVSGSPYALQITATTFNLYARRTDGYIYQAYWDGSKFSPWMKISASAGASANPSSAYGRGQYIFSLNSTNTPVFQVWNSRNWTGWNTFAFPATKFMSPVKGGDDIVLYGIDANGVVQKASLSDAGTWNPATPVNCVPGEI